MEKHDLSVEMSCRHLFLVTKMNEKRRKQFGPVNLACRLPLDISS